MTRPTPINPEDRVSWVYSAASPSEVQERYDAWAADYDRDLTETFDYILPERCAAELAEVIDPGSRVLDAGAGTGLVGHHLARHGFHNIVGIDLSAGMLRRARETDGYVGLAQARLGDPMPFCDAGFDAAVAVGVFTDGHAPASALPELVRVVRPGGVVLIPIRPDILASHGFAAMFARLAAEGAWRELSVSAPYAPMPRGEPGVRTETRVWRVL